MGAQFRGKEPSHRGFPGRNLFLEELALLCEETSFGKNLKEPARLLCIRESSFPKILESAEPLPRFRSITTKLRIESRKYKV